LNVADSEQKASELAGKLAGYGGPAYLKAYLSRLLESGDGFARAGDARAAAYCFDKVEAGLKDAPASPADSAAAPVEDKPLDRLRLRWQGEAVRSAETVLERHGGRLSSLEKKSFRDRIEKAKTSERPEITLPDLRRRLYTRVLRAQKSGLAGRRRGMLSDAMAATFEGPVGPYNDRLNMQGLLDTVGAADAAWVEEFLDLYRDLAGLRGLLSAAASIKK
jgi:hypothetical protein